MTAILTGMKIVKAVQAAVAKFNASYPASEVYHVEVKELAFSMFYVEVAGTHFSGSVSYYIHASEVA